MVEVSCKVPDCGKRATRPNGSRLCKMHAERLRRNGTLDTIESLLPAKRRIGCGYNQLHRPGHPLATDRGTVYEHRVVLYELIGPGWHDCHWCSASITWDIRRGAGALEVDHLNANGRDNRPENLVPSCRGCNTTRARRGRLELIAELRSTAA